MLPTVRLVRLEENATYGTFGVWIIQSRVYCVTLEPPDRLNIQRKSSIPAQQYICRRHESPKFGDTFLVTEVPGRDLVLLHPGNFVDETLGCIILAQHYGKLNVQGAEKRAVLNSGNTFRSFMKLMGNTQRFQLTVKEHY